jgi:Arm DNA-binding domain
LERSGDRGQEAQEPGEGGAYPYKTTAGDRWRVKGMVGQPDGSLKEVNKRGFLTKKDALAWLADAQSAGREGEYIEPSRQRFGAYCA